MKQKIEKLLVILMATVIVLSGMNLQTMAEEVGEEPSEKVSEEVEESSSEEMISETTEAGEDFITVTIEGWGAGFDMNGTEIFEDQNGCIEVLGDKEKRFGIIDAHTAVIERSLADSSLDLCIYTGWTYAETLKVTYLDGHAETYSPSAGYGSRTSIDLADVRDIYLSVGTLEEYISLFVIDQRNQSATDQELSDSQNESKGEVSLRSAAPSSGTTTITLMPDSGHSGRAYDDANGNHLFCLDMSMGVPSDGQTFYYSDLASFLSEAGQSSRTQALYFVLYNYWTNRYPGTGTPTYEMIMCSEEDWPYQNMMTGVIWKLMGFEPAGYGTEYKDAIEDMAEEALAYAASFPNGRYPENSIIESVGALYPETGSSTQPMISVGAPVYKGYLQVHKESDRASEEFLLAHPVTGAVYGVFMNESEAQTAQAKQTSTNTQIDAGGTLAVLTIGVSGYSEILELSPGTYWIVEITRPTDTVWQWDPVIHAVNVSAQDTKDDPAMIKSNEKLIGSLKLTKSSSNTAATNGNTCYDMTGIRFDVYAENTGTSAAPVLSGKVGSLRIVSYDPATSSGETDVLENLAPGTYWIQEAESSTIGTGFVFDPTVRSVTIEPDQTAEVVFQDAPTLDPNRIQIFKSSSTQGERRITESSATFRVEFYDNYTWSGNPARTWYFKTSQGFVFLNNLAYLDPAYSNSTLFTTSSSGNAFPLGSIRITEEKAPEGYLASEFELKGIISLDNNGEAAFQWVSPSTGGKLKYESDGSAVYLNEAVYAGVRFQKVDLETGLGCAQGSAGLSDASIGIYNASGKTIMLKDGTQIEDGSLALTMITDQAGQAESSADALPAGSYYAVEVARPEGYQINNSWKVEFSITEADHEQILDLTENSNCLKEQIIRGGVALEKWDTDLMSQTAQGDADFAGISFQIITLGDNPVRVEGIDYIKGQVVCTLTTDENGNASTGDSFLPYGKYQIEEVSTNGKYLLTSGEAQIIWIRNEKEIILANVEGGKIVFSDEIGKGAAAIEKQDEEAETAQGDASFAGIRYALVNRSLKDVKVGDTVYAPGHVVMILSLGQDGTAATDERSLPYGTYGIYELRTDAEIEPGELYNHSDKLGTSPYANENGYLFREQSGKIEIRMDGQTEKVRFTDSVVHGGVSFTKIDKECGYASPQGHGTLEGASIEIVNRSQHSVYVKGVCYEPGEVVLTLVTDQNGNCRTEENILPYGTYEAHEKEASRGYLVSDWKAVFEIGEEGEMIETAPLPEMIKRCDLCFSKVDIDGSPMPGIPFRISLIDPEGKVIESHIIVSDVNGIVNTKIRTKTKENINILDEYVKDGRFTDESMLDGAANVWFGVPDEESLASERGSLIYGQYRIEEVQCQNNQGQVMLMQEVFIDPSSEETIDLSEVFEDDTLKVLDNLFIDLIIHPSTDLIDVTSESNILTIGEEVPIRDTFHYDHLKVGQTYHLTTKIYYEDTDGQICLIGEKKVAFEPEKTDSTNTAYGTVKTEITIDSSGLESGIVHAVSILSAEKEGEEIELLVHNQDLKDKRQQLHLPSIRTVASDTHTNDHAGTLDKQASIRDIVYYKNLAHEHMYRFVAVLKEADSGNIVLDVDGSECIVQTILRVSRTAEIVSEKSYGYLGPISGEITMPAFTFDATAYAGKTLVVTEYLFDYDLYDEDLPYTENEKALILQHDSLSDKDQQVSYPAKPEEESSSEPEEESSSESSSEPESESSLESSSETDSGSESSPEPEKPGPNPKTGDHMPVGFYTGAIVMALAALVFVLLIRHQNQTKKNN